MADKKAIGISLFWWFMHTKLLTDNNLPAMTLAQLNKSTQCAAVNAKFNEWHSSHVCDFTLETNATVQP